MREQINKLLKRFLILFPFFIAFLVILQFVFIARFNKFVYSVSGADASSPSYMDLDARKDSTSYWLKRDFEWNDAVYDLQAQTIDGNLINNSNDTINDWSLRINIKEDCFVNNAWCGTMEIHQYVGTEEEKTQLLDLRNYELDDIELAYFYDGDLLIPLRSGDYIIYTPSTKDNEAPVAPNSDITMGVIFYYFDSKDFYDYQLDYTYFRTFTYGPLYLIIAVMLLFWALALIITLISMQIYKDAQKQLEMKKSGLMSMSDIYLVIYIVDLKTGEIIPVIEEPSGELVRPKEKDAAAQIAYLFENDATEEYRELATNFCDIMTLAERMQDKNSIACEYLSKHLGWCSIRFFAMDRIEGRTPDRVLFTIQVIDSEKKEMEAIQEEIFRAQRESLEQGAFLRGISDEILNPAQEILALNEKLLVPGTDENVLDIAKKIKRTGTKLNGIVNDVLDYSLLESREMTANMTTVSLREIIFQIRDQVSVLLDGKASTELLFDIAPTVPVSIQTDGEMLQRILVLLTTVAIEHTSSGSVKLSIFGKAFDEEVHLVFSVRDTGNGQQKESTQIGLRLSDALLKLIGSELFIVNTPEDGSESYFELTTTAGSKETLGDINTGLLSYNSAH